MGKINFLKRYIAGPQSDCPWVSKMVLNPAIINNILHMLFRATGPLPYPIFLGYAVSYDSGKNWNFDFSGPAMSPALKYNENELWTHNIFNQRMINYANGCIEDPHLFYFEEELYLSAACRVFPPGPYWDYDDPVQCMPEWIFEGAHNLGKAVVENSTVTLLYKVERDYSNTFALVGPLHHPDISDDRDAFLFPRRVKIKGEKRILCIHRPKHPWNYAEGKDLKAPSVFLTASDSLSQLSGNDVKRQVLAVPEFEWEKNHIGASWTPIELSPGEWLLPYHTKQDDQVGYTQSFMILKERADGFPVITHRPATRLMYASEKWELGGDFNIPCLFTCS